MAKRNLAKEILSGFDDLNLDRQGKITLRRTKVPRPAPTKLTGALIIKIREAFKMSRPVFARKLHINERTLEKWEQDRSTPTGPAAALILMASKYPDTIERLDALE